MRAKPTLYEYIQRLQIWRERYERHLDSRPRLQSLELLSHYLTDFQHGKFDEIEVPGQYTEVGIPTYLLYAILNKLMNRNIGQG